MIGIFPEVHFNPFLSAGWYLTWLAQEFGDHDGAASALTLNDEYQGDQELSRNQIEQGVHNEVSNFK